jgi:hypothetical protein
MCRGVALVTGLLICLLPGCFTPEQRCASSFKRRFQNYENIDPTGMVQIEVRLIETPLGDSFLNHELWDKAVDEQAVDFERRGILAKNGLRVGSVAGALPSRLQELMTLERCCVNPKVLLLGAGRVSTIHLGPSQPECQFQLSQPGQSRTVEFAQAQFSLAVLPGLTEDGNICLRFAPKAEFGDPIQTFQPAPDRSGWVMEIRRQSQLFDALNWEVPLTPNTFLVIGGMLDKPDSLGYHAFVDRESMPPVQRLLVLRTGRVENAGIDAEIAPTPVGHSVQPSPIPLATQAVETSARAYHP